MTPIFKLREVAEVAVVKDVFSHLPDDVTVYDLATYDLSNLKRGDVVLSVNLVEPGIIKEIFGTGAMLIRMSSNPWDLRYNYSRTKDLVGQ